MGLPSREAVAEWLENGSEVVDGHELDEVLALYADGTLMTAEEAQREANAEISKWESERGL